MSLADKDRRGGAPPPGAYHPVDSTDRDPEPSLYPSVEGVGITRWRSPARSMLRSRRWKRGDRTAQRRPSPCVRYLERRRSSSWWWPSVTSVLPPTSPSSDLSSQERYIIFFLYENSPKKNTWDKRSMNTTLDITSFSLYRRQGRARVWPLLVWFLASLSWFPF